MNKLILLLISICVLSSFTAPSDMNEGTDVKHAFQTNGKETIIHQIMDEYGTPQYYYTDINGYPTKGDKHAKTMNLRMYWDAMGNYLTFEIRNGKELTKINGKAFSNKDYKKLHHILNNSNSELKHYKYDDLSSKQCENQYQVDAISGATSTEYEFEYINGAIKTTYALWHVAHGSIAKEIKALNNTYCSQQTLNNSMTMENYDNATTVAKFIFLNSLHSSQKTLSNSDVTILINDLPTDSYAIFSAIITVLDSNSDNVDALYSSLITFLTGQQFKQIESYNTLEINDQHRDIKQTALDFHHITF